jgi:hypothetical protein
MIKTSKTKLDLFNITLVAVACVRVEKTIKAMKYSMNGIHFGAVKLITSEVIEDDIIDVIQIDKLDYNAFNHFVVYELWKYIETEYALRIEDDGFIVHRNGWRKDFLDYDYIGAPWPMPQDTFSYRDPFGNLIRVGNGGFSLRSRKLLKLPTDLNMEWKPYFGFYHEDGFISCHNRHLFEAAGCVFAPLEVAKYFSHEYEIPENEGIVPFGFHGKFSSYNALLIDKKQISFIEKIKTIVYRLSTKLINNQK